LQETRSLLKDGVTNVTGYIVSLVLTFVMTPILIRGLGTQPYGVWTLVESVVTYLALADAGVGAALVRFVSKYRGANDSDGINEVFNTTVAIFALAGFGAAVCTAVLCVFAPVIFQLPPDLQTEARWLLAAGGFTFSLGLPLSAYNSTLTGLRRYGRINVIQNTLLVVRYALLMLVVACDGGLRGVAAALVITSIVGHIWRAITVHRLLPSLRLSREWITRETVNQIFGYSAYVFMAGAASKLQVNAVIIGMFLAPQYITYYAVGSLLLRRGSILIRTALSVLTPTFGMLEGRNDYQAIRDLLTAAMKFAFLAVVPFQLGLLFLGKSFLQLWVGSELAEQSFRILSVLAASLPFLACNWVGNRMLQGIGQVKRYAAYSALQSIVNFLLAWILIQWLGILGVAISTALCESVYSITVASLAFRAADMKLLYYLPKMLSKPLLLGAILAGFWYSALRFQPIEHWLGFVTHLALGLVVYGLALTAIEPSVRSRTVRWIRAQSFSDKSAIGAAEP
jgi:O-antigen/teichoic acid export membrane protein